MYALAHATHIQRKYYAHESFAGPQGRAPPCLSVCPATTNNSIQQRISQKSNTQRHVHADKDRCEPRTQSSSHGKTSRFNTNKSGQASPPLLTPICKQRRKPPSIPRRTAKTFEPADYLPHISFLASLEWNIHVRTSQQSRYCPPAPMSTAK